MKHKDISLTLKTAFMPEGHSGSLEDTLRALFKAAPDLASRMVNVDFYSQVVFSTLENHPLNHGAFLRAYIIENQAVGMINVSGAAAAVDLLEMLPPDGHKFVRNEIVLYIVGNKAISFGVGRRNSQFSRLLSTALVDHSCMQGLISIEDVPKKASLKELREVGVRSIDLSVTDYLESLASARDMPAVLRAIFASPLSQEAALKRAKTVGRLQLKRGRALKAEEFIRDEYLTRVGEKVLTEEEDDGFKIVLENGRVLRPNSFKMTKSYSVPAHANSASYPHVKAALADFARELTRQGLM